MKWLIAYTDSLGGAQTDTDCPVITADATITTDGASHPLLPIPLYLEWAYLLSATATRGRINTPKFRPIARPLIRPLEAAATPSSRPQFCEYWRTPLKFNAVEPIQILTTYTAAGERRYVLLSFTDLNFNVPQGDLYTVRGTTAFTPTANAWTTSGAITFDDVLMGGQYSILGLDVGNTGGIAARLAFPGPPLPGMIAQVRPGVIMQPNLTSQGTRYFRWGALGEYGRFESFAPPQLEVIQTGATTNPEFYLDIIQTRQGARAS
jgi:hypothetical protein